VVAVGIDRPEDGDTPDDVPARRAGGDAAPLSDPFARMAEQAWYRGTVEKVYAAARGAWAEAVPGLCAAWEKHEQQYPERTRLAPRTQADGSWVADGGRELDPEQNAESTKACAETRDEGREVVLPAMRRVEAGDPERRLAGLEHMLKGEDRLKEKIADVLLVESHLTARQALDKVPDAVRFTLTYSTERYAEGVRADVERLKAEGFELIKLKNLWADDQYKGINSQWRRPETGLRFEMQFHTPESLEAKELTHKAYERLRRPETETSQIERDELEDYQRRVNVLLVTPPGTASIKDFPEKRNDDGQHNLLRDP
jgi:hypothetical protein